MIATVTKNDLVALGFSEGTSKRIIRQGEDYLVVKERLGHASITTTIDTYSHCTQASRKTWLTS